MSRTLWAADSITFKAKQKHLLERELSHNSNLESMKEAAILYRLLSNLGHCEVCEEVHFYKCRNAHLCGKLYSIQFVNLNESYYFV